MVNPYFETFKVRAAEIGPNEVAKPTAIINYFQEAAWQHADLLGVSVPALMERGHTWVMHRLFVEVLQPIKKNGELRIETWPSAIEKFFTYRDFRFTDKNKDLVARGATAWVVIDLKKRRLIPIPDYIAGGNFVIDNGHLPHPEEKLPDMQDPTAGPSFRVYYHHLDQNNHVNNVHYLEWMLASLPQDYLANMLIQSTDIQFKSECKLGDEVLTEYRQLNDSEVLHRLVESSSGREVARAVTRWRDNDSISTF